MLLAAASVVILALFVILSLHLFDAVGLSAAFKSMWGAPMTLLGMTVGYLAAFLLRAAAWRLYIGQERGGRSNWLIYVNPLLVSLLINHLLPVKAGDAARAGMIMRSLRMRWDEALHSVAVMRAFDMAALLSIGGIGAVLLGVRFSSSSAMPFAIAVAVGVSAAGVMLAIAVRRGWRRIIAHANLIGRVMTSRQGVIIVLLVLASWLLEGLVLYGVAAETSAASLSLLQAVWANSMTVAGQIFHVTPGGIGTYETTMTASLTLLGMKSDEAYAAAIVSHAYKFAFSYGFGLFACVLGTVSLRNAAEWIGRKGRGRERLQPPDRIDTKGES